MYHGLHTGREDGIGFDSRYSVHPSAFSRQMAMLEDSGNALSSISEDSMGTPGLRVIVSFDDGDITNSTVALPILYKHRLRAIFFITSGRIGKRGMVSKKQVLGLAEAGMIIGAHGDSHRFLTSLSDSELDRELCVSRDVLSHLSGQPVDFLSLPGGRESPRVIAAATRAGYKWIFGSRPALNTFSQSSSGLGRALGRVAIDRDLSDRGFAGLITWRGSALHWIRARHSILSLPKQLLGDQRYDRLRRRIIA